MAVQVRHDAGGAIVAVPMVNPSASLDFSVDITAWMADVGDSLFTVSAATVPSRADGLALTDTPANGNIITVEMSGGVARGPTWSR